MELADAREKGVIYLEPPPLPTQFSFDDIDPFREYKTLRIEEDGRVREVAVAKKADEEEMAVKRVILFLFSSVELHFKTSEGSGGFINYIDYFLIKNSSLPKEEFVFLSRLKNLLGFSSINQVELFDLLKVMAVFSKYNFVYLKHEAGYSIVEDFKQTALEYKESLSTSADPAFSQGLQRLDVGGD